MSSSTQQKGKDASSQGNSTMAWLFSMSIFIATANTLLYKAALNAFSSPTTNYGFFASQFSILLYVFQALIFSIFVVARDFNSIKELFRIPQKVYLCMGFLDSASGTLGAIAGFYTNIFLFTLEYSNILLYCYFNDILLIFITIL